MSGRELALTLDVLAALALALVMLPTVVYLFTVWQSRRDKLFGVMTGPALWYYFQRFPLEIKPRAHRQSATKSPARPARSTVDHDAVPGDRAAIAAILQTDIGKLRDDDFDTLCTRFHRRFTRLYGRGHYVLPLLLLLAIATTALWFCLRAMQASFHVAPMAMPLSRTVLFALAGGFIWIISDALDRIARRDINPVDIYGWAFRLALCVPFGLAAGYFFHDVPAAAIAFFIGVFPTQTLFTLGRRVAVTKLELGDGNDTAMPELTDLQSVSRINAEAFSDAGINSIAALAWCDPVDLAVRTNYDFNYVLDCMSQALLWVYFEGQTRTLFPYGIRGSQEALGFICTYDRRSAREPHLYDEVHATADAAAAAIKLPTAAFLTALRQVSDDPYTLFLNELWSNGPVMPAPCDPAASNADADGQGT